ncbi:MAG TPA: NB-ARC domain-containing protein, partial [Fimbriimonadaceae bacterium]|nr:NB-ARC domain-containing protein [Fimbriimonadaceae bacterium]
MTFLTTDIVGFSALFELDQERARALTLQHFDLIQSIVDKWGGAMFKTAGDAAWAAFTSAPSAVRAALEIARRLRETPDLEELKLRTALLTGEAAPSAGDYLAPVLNRCSRVINLCPPGGVLVGATTHELTRLEFGYRALGTAELRGVPDQEIWQLDEPELVAELMDPLVSGKRRKRALPSEELRFVGRVGEKSELATRLSDPGTRLVTVTGMGGIGKTRLCTEVARELQLQFKDGVTFVECESLTNESELLSAVASAMDLDDQVHDLDSLAGALSSSEQLLLLDCFERLVDSRSVVESLLKVTTGLKILVSSRVVLGLPREYEFALGPLGTRVREGSRSEACTLFWDVAEHVAPRIKPTRTHANTANQIVEALEGVPLAILLAATRLSHMALEELLDQVRRRRLETLKRSPIAAVDRHENLIRVIDDSFSLLQESELQLIFELSVFRGFFMDDALAVLGDDDRVRDGVARLRSSSLLVAQTHGARMRFRILDTIREYIERRGSDRVADALRANHADHYTRTAVAVRAKAEAGEWRTTTRLLWLEMGNYREAIDFAVRHGRADLLDMQARSLARPMAEAGMTTEFNALSKAVATSDGSLSKQALAELEGLRGMLARGAGDLPAARAHWIACAELWNRAGDRAREADVLSDVIDVSIGLGDLEAARRGLAQFNEARIGAGSDDGLTISGKMLEARIALAEGDKPLARELGLQALETTEKTAGDR